MGHDVCCCISLLRCPRQRAGSVLAPYVAALLLALLPALPYDIHVVRSFEVRAKGGRWLV